VSQPLAGHRVLVTRAAHQAGKLSDWLRALGAAPVEVPVLEIQPPESYAPFDSALRRLASYDWLILTSTNTVHVLVERCAALGIVSTAPGPQVAAIGSATAQAARDAGFAVSLTPENYVAESMVLALKDQMSGRRFLLARAADARDVIPDALRGAGAVVDVADAYRNAIPEAAPQQLRRAIAEGLNAATFTSSSSVVHLADVARAAQVAFPLAHLPAISIGPVTSETLRVHGWSPAAEANPHDIPGLVQAVLKVLREPRYPR
jgi:uroporphyrinogen-III synthase/uroporphyrinogen III methyltransferase/synthase